MEIIINLLSFLISVFGVIGVIMFITFFTMMIPYALTTDFIEIFNKYKYLKHVFTLLIVSFSITFISLKIIQSLTKKDYEKLIKTEKIISIEIYNKKYINQELIHSFIHLKSNPYYRRNERDKIPAVINFQKENVPIEIIPVISNPKHFKILYKKFNTPEESKCIGIIETNQLKSIIQVNN